MLAGAIWTQDRKYRANMVDSAVCPFCESGRVEDHDHMWWHCEAWTHIRQRYADISSMDVAAWPPCLRTCGLMPVSWEPPGEAAEQSGIDQTANLVVDLTGDDWNQEQMTGTNGWPHKSTKN
eukprot:2390331-Karenia_brevis.AAC.1